MSDIPPLEPDLGLVLTMRNTLIMGIDQLAGRFFYLALNLHLYIFLLIILELDELNYMHEDMDFDFDEVVNSLSTLGYDE